MTSSLSFDSKFKFYVETFENYLLQYLSGFGKDLASESKLSIEELIKSMTYSLKGGGKRFRPVLGLAMADFLEVSLHHVLPWQLAVEMIHTYSLIHDDLPCMDNDDLRRGRPTNHKVFGEALALLAGDGLLTESFNVIAENYSSHVRLSELIKLLSRSAGYKGMIGGQVFDMVLSKEIQLKNRNAEIVPVPNSLTGLLNMHSLKTGKLISSSVCGVGILADLGSADLIQIENFGDKIGAAFQVADDILDFEEAKASEKLKNMGALFGVETCKSLLVKLKDDMQSILLHFSQKNNHKSFSFIEELIDFNMSRKG